MVVFGWDNTLWTERQTRVIHQMCHHYKTKLLLLIPNATVPQFLLQEETLANPMFCGQVPFLYHLEMICVLTDFTTIPIEMNSLLSASRVRALSWPSKTTRNHVVTTIRGSLVINKHLDHNHSIVKIEYGNESILEQPPFDEHWDYIRMIIERNKDSLERCRKACIIFLTPRLKKERRIDPNVCKLIASMIWETRGTSAWKPL